MNTYIKQFNEINIGDIPTVGGKNASLGEMFSKFAAKGISVPDGFATTAGAFQDFLKYNSLTPQLNELMKQLDKNKYLNLRETGLKARKLLLNAHLPEELGEAIIGGYKKLCGNENYFEVAVRSSATAEDLPEASFAGQHESYLNIKGEEALLDAVKRCYASLYTDRAIKYREDNGFGHEKVSLSVGSTKNGAF